MLLQMRKHFFSERKNSRIKSKNQYSYEQSEVLAFLVARVSISACEMRGLTVQGRDSFCKPHGAGRIGKADSRSSGQPSDNYDNSSSARQSSLQSSLLSCWDFTHSFSSRSVQQMLSETPFLCLASVYAQELLDYLKQFDKDGKGALSKEELQEVMRGRMRCGWDLKNYDR